MFHVKTPPVDSKLTGGIDHPYLETLVVSNNVVSFIATPRRKADGKAPEEMYWSLEKLTFDQSGKLLSREPVRDF